MNGKVWPNGLYGLLIETLAPMRLAVHLWQKNLANLLY